MPEMNNMKVGNDVYEVADPKSRGVSLTWAQYQALSYEEQHNGTAYYITDRDAIYPVDHELNANSSNAVANDVVTPHILAMENVLGAKNKINTGAARAYSSARGFDVTVNADGSITLSGGVATGTWGECFNAFYIKEDMILTGCPSQSGEDFKLDFTDFGGHTFNDYGEGVDIPYSASYANNLFYARIWVNPGADFTTPKTFYPMIRPDGTDPTYVKHAMTNAELTDRIDAGSIYHGLSSLIWNSGDTITIPLPDKIRRGMLVSIVGNYPLNVSSLYYVGGGSQGYRVGALSENGTTLTYDGTNNVLIATKTSANADDVDVAVISISGFAG